MNFAQIAKELREETGLSQKALSEKIGISSSGIGHLELGQREPGSSTLMAYSKYFGVTTDFLLGLTNEYNLKNQNEKNLIERPSYEITDKQLIDFIKLYEVMTDLQKAHILGYVIAYLETNGVNVKTVLGY